MLTVGEFRDLFNEDGIVLVAGYENIDRKIDYINVQEIDRKSSWTRKNGFVMTTFKDFENIDNILLQLEWYSKMNVSAVGFHAAIHSDSHTSTLIINKANELNLPLFRIPSNIPYYFVFEKVNTYLKEQSEHERKQVRQVREKMIHTVLDDQDSSQIIKTLGEYLNAPVIHLDQLRNAKAIYPVNDTEQEIKNILQNIIEHEAHLFEENDEYKNKVTKSYPTTTDKEITFTIYPLKSGVYFIGYLLVGLTQSKPLYEQAINHGINALLLDATKNQAINQYLKNQDIILLEDIIKGNVDEVDQEKFNFPVQSIKQLLLWEIDDRSDMEEKYLIMDGILKKWFDTYFLWIFENQIIGLTTKPIRPLIIDELNEKIPTGLIALSGIIKEYSTIKIKKLYDQALIAMKYMKANNDTIVSWNELSFNRVVYFLHDQLIFEDYGELITPLIKKDRKDGTDLVNTLYVYLKNFFSYTEAAKVLFVHPNTVKYRIDQINQLLGNIDFRNHKTYLDLMMAIKLYHSSNKE